MAVPDSFSWYLQALKEKEQQQRQQKRDPSAMPDESQEIKLLRFIKVFKPTFGKLSDFVEKDLRLTLSAGAELLERLERDGQLESVEDSLRITPKGLSRL